MKFSVILHKSKEWPYYNWQDCYTIFIKDHTNKIAYTNKDLMCFIKSNIHICKANYNLLKSEILFHYES